MREPDLWDKRPPRIDFLTDRELLMFLHIGREENGFSDAEVSICQSCINALRYKRRLSERQEGVLRRGLLKQLWDADPDLWNI